jgi:hypothetical protein
MQQQAATEQASIPGILSALSIPHRGVPVIGGFSSC